MHTMAERLVTQGMAQVGAIHGDGFEIMHCQPGRGFSYQLYGRKQLTNGRSVAKHLFMPGPFDALAGLATTLVETYSVWVGWEAYSPEYEALYDAPPLPLPAKATGWSNSAWDGPRHWYADFATAEDAEAFALTLPSALDDEPPLPRRP